MVGSVFLRFYIVIHISPTLFKSVVYCAVNPGMIINNKKNCQIKCSQNKDSYKSYLTLLARGVGVDSTPPSGIFEFLKILLVSIPWKLVTFPNYKLTWFRNQKNLIFLRGYHLQAPSKILFFLKIVLKKLHNFYCRFVYY